MLKMSNYYVRTENEKKIKAMFTVMDQIYPESRCCDVKEAGSILMHGNPPWAGQAVPLCSRAHAMEADNVSPSKHQLLYHSWVIAYMFLEHCDVHMGLPSSPLALSSVLTGMRGLWGAESPLSE